MTLYGLIASVIWAGVAVLFIVMVSGVADEWIDLKRQTTEEPADLDIPDDLAALALGENEKWAQEETIKVIRERYATYRDWNQVRAAMGVAQRDG